MTWLRPDEAIAAFAAEHLPAPSLTNLRVIAHREHWRRAKVGHDARYDLDDVTETVLRRRQRVALQQLDEPCNVQ